MTSELILSEVQTTAMELMQKHGLIEKDWGFKFDNAGRRFGYCKYTTLTISLSEEMVLLNWEERKEEVIDTILHEIAHALVRVRFGRKDKYGRPIKGHGSEWKAVCVEIGARPIRCYSPENVKIVQGKYIYKCPHCGKEFHYHKRKKCKSACGDCCKKYNNNRFSDKYILVLVSPSLS